MVWYGFIDESGTKHDQQVMAVSLVVLSHAHAHTKIHQRVLKAIYPNLNERTKEAKANGAKRPGMHFTDMDESSRKRAAEVLALNEIGLISGIHYHEGCPKDYPEFLARYCNMVCSVVSRALNTFEDLELTVARINGPGRPFELSLNERLDKCREDIAMRAGYRRLRVRFGEASVAGIQIADFYAGARRESLLPDCSAPSGAFARVEHQLMDEIVEAADLAAQLEQLKSRR